MPEISVVVVTYNHARFVGRAVESVLSQVTARPFEIIISEDCSTDGTREIVRDFAARDPRVRLILSERNMRSNEVVARGIRAAKGKYVCILDGDDFWTVPDKLERQATILDGDLQASACFHNAVIVIGSSMEPGEDRWTSSAQATRTGANEIWRGNPFATCAGMLRRDALAKLGDWYAGLFPITDWPLYILAASHGELIFVDEVVGAYRLHEQGMFSSKPGDEKLRMTSGLYRRMKSAMGPDYHRAANRGGFLYFLEWAQEHARAGDDRLKRLCLWHAAKAGSFSPSLPWRRLLAVAGGRAA